MPMQARSRISPYAFVVFEELHFANVEFFFFRAFPTLVAMRTKQQVVMCCPPTSWVGLYFMGRPVHFVPAQPHKTASQRRPKGSLSLTHIEKSDCLQIVTKYQYSESAYLEVNHRCCDNLLYTNSNFFCLYNLLFFQSKMKHQVVCRTLYF